MASEQDQKYIDFILGTEHEDAETAAAILIKMIRDIAREEVASAFGFLMRRTQDIGAVMKAPGGAAVAYEVSVGELERMFGEGLQNFSSDSGAPGD
jgi:hypothetical protein